MNRAIAVSTDKFIVYYLGIFFGQEERLCRGLQQDNIHYIVDVIDK